MTIEQFNEWRKERGTAYTEEYINGVKYGFVRLKDGWIGVVKHNQHGVTGIFAADTMEHARDRCAMIEEPCVRLTPLFPEDKTW